MPQNKVHRMAQVNVCLHGGKILPMEASGIAGFLTYKVESASFFPLGFMTVPDENG